jgi:hypothetical protein
LAEGDYVFSLKKSEIVCLNSSLLKFRLKSRNNIPGNGGKTNGLAG